MEQYFYERMYPINLLEITKAKRRDDLEEVKNCIEMERFFENKSNSNRTPNIIEDGNPEKKYLELYFPNVNPEEMFSQFFGGGGNPFGGGGGMFGGGMFGGVVIYIESFHSAVWHHPFGFT